MKAFLILVVFAGSAFGHVTIQPKQSAAGATERYTLRVPTEKFVPTVRVEIEFPTGLEVSTFDMKPDWKMEFTKNPEGEITGVVLIGSIGPAESSQFTFVARNPGEGKLTFKAIQIYEDGTRAEWTGAEGSRTPAPVVEIVRAPIR